MRSVATFGFSSVGKWSNSMFPFALASQAHVFLGGKVWSEFGFRH